MEKFIQPQTIINDYKSPPHTPPAMIIEEPNNNNITTTITTPTELQNTYSSQIKPPIKYTKVLSIDPGLKNTWFTLMLFTDNDVYLMEEKKFSFNNDGSSKTNYNPCPDKAYFNFDLICEYIKTAHPDVVLIEFQPPIGNYRSLIRNNCWVEGLLLGAIAECKVQFQMINPSAVRSKMLAHKQPKIPMRCGDRKSSCRAFMENHYPKEYAILKDNEHTTDCFLMALYWMGWLNRGV